MICADSNNQLKQRSKLLMNRLKERNVTVNAQKCISNTPTLTFLGHTFSSEGIKTDKSLVKNVYSAT